MKIGLVGFAGSGKTTVFNAMTGLNVPVGIGGDIRLGTVKVPDDRIDTLSSIFSPKKTTYAEMRFCDIPGEYGADKKGLSPRALQQIRDQEALCLVLRDFVNPDLADEPDPTGDLQAFSSECLLADLEIVERRLDRIRKEGGNAVEIATLEKAYTTLMSEHPLRALSDQELNRELLRGYGLLTDRPLLVILNHAEINAANDLPRTLKDEIETLGAGGLALSASVEAEIADLDLEDQVAFLEDLGLQRSALTRFIRTSYALLDLISFFTVGPDEVRAWTITRGMTARPAAGRIHSDLERGFIRAEVTPYDVFMKYGSEQAVKEAGRLQVEGKDYVVSDGDILHVRFNV
jgi:GTP-binding protein YchF